MSIVSCIHRKYPDISEDILFNFIYIKLTSERLLLWVSTDFILAGVILYVQTNTWSTYNYILQSKGNNTSKLDGCFWCRTCLLTHHLIEPQEKDCRKQSSSVVLTLSQGHDTCTRHIVSIWCLNILCKDIWKSFLGWRGT